MSTEKEEEVLLEAGLRLVYEFFLTEPLYHHEPKCDSYVIDAVSDMLALQLGDIEDIEPESIVTAAEGAVHSYRAMFVPPREHDGSPILCHPDTRAIGALLQAIQSVPQPDQRTPEWYAFRGRYLTASSAWKAFATEGALNQLIYDKCRAAQMDPEEAGRVGGGVNVESPLHWGQKYEPVSVMWYEQNYNTKVGEFGCIPHPTIKCLAASPDGINIEPDNPRYGRMLEIKNVVSREITGIPKKEYWIQMQLQMAVCGLSECDFLEMKFHEYENDEEWERDGDFMQAADGKMKGRIVQFMVSGSPAYEYQPLGLDKTEAECWERRIHESHTGDTWIRDIYWKLEVVSCVLVEFNAAWMAAAETRLNATWDIIQLEKRTGFEHRAPQKRKREVTVVQGGKEPPSSCLLVSDGTGGFKPLPGGSSTVHPHCGGPPHASDIRVITSPLGRIGTCHSN